MPGVRSVSRRGGLRLSISRKLTAFHLDKLLEHGLLRPIAHARPDARVRGRPQRQVLRALRAQIEVTISEHRYNLAGELLVAAIR